jgi:hypothetical protein
MAAIHRLVGTNYQRCTVSGLTPNLAAILRWLGDDGDYATKGRLIRLCCSRASASSRVKRSSCSCRSGDAGRRSPKILVHISNFIPVASPGASEPE